LLHDGATAESLLERDAVRPAESVLVTAAAGGMGVLLVQFASAAGVPLGPVLSITPVAASSPPVFAPNAAASSGSGAVPISPGSQQVSVSVTVVYAT